MSERRQQVLVGAVFVLSIAVLVAGVLWFKDFKLGTRRAQVTVEFPSTSGLVKGDLVEVSGVTSGQVAEIRYEEGRSLVVLELDKQVRLYPTSRFVIENVGIMGQKLVAIYPEPSGAPAPLDSTIFHGDYQSGIPQLMSDLGATLEAFNRLATRLDKLLETFDASNEGGLVRTLENTEKVSAELAAFLKETRGELGQSVRNFSNAMQDLHQTLDGREEKLGKMLDNTSQAAARLDSALVSFHQTSNQLRGVLSKLESGDGTLGQMMQDDQLYQELTLTLRETRILVEDIRANPKKYVKLSLF